VMCPTLRGRILKVSMPLAMLGLLIFLSASITSASSDGVAALLDQERAERLDRLADGLEVGIDRQRLLEALERAGGLVEAEPDHAVAAQRAEMGRVALEHLVAVGGGLAVLADQVVDGGALVPALGEIRATADDLAEGVDGGLELAVLHLGDAGAQQVVHVLVAGAAPHLPQRALRQPPHPRVGIGAMAIQRSPAGSYISVASKMRKGASPPNTRMRSGSAAAARPPRPRGNGAPVRQASAAGS